MSINHPHHQGYDLWALPKHHNQIFVLNIYDIKTHKRTNLYFVRQDVDDVMYIVSVIFGGKTGKN